MTQRGDDGFHVEARALREVDALGQPLQHPDDADLVDHLRELAGAGRTHVRYRAGIGGDDRLRRREGGLVAADHHGELARLRPGLPARDRRIEEMRAAFERRRVKLPRDGGRGRGVVDEDRARLQGMERAAQPGRDRAQIIIVADAGEDEVRAVRRGRRRFRSTPSVALGPGLRLGGRAVVDGNLVSAPLAQMACHRETHDAQTDEGDLAHRFSPVIPVQGGVWMAI